MTFGLTTEIITLLNQTFAQYPKIIQVKVFGSRALDNYQPSSDIDLVLYGNISETLLATLNSLLDELPTPYLFDLVVYERINHAPLKEHIDTYAKLLYQRS